jgi:hypothetical protein
MNSNVGSFDRILRIVLGIVLGVLYFNGTLAGGLGIAALIVGIVLIVTALIKFCPLYRILGLNTCSTK